MKRSEKEKQINKLINEYLPGVKLNAIRSGSDKEVFDAYYAVSNENKDLKDSQYYYRAERKFIHFTSLLALESIVQSKMIRLYNLFNLNDPREYSFSAKIFDYNHKNRDEAKLNMFLLSMCKTDIFKRNFAKDEFNMWRLYGHNGYGIGVELDFKHCELDDWRDFYLSEIFYGASSRTKLNELADLLSSLEKQKPNCTLDLGQLMCFHKSNLYSVEKEVRLLYDMRQTKVFQEATYTTNANKKIMPIIRTDITKSMQSKKDTKYLELPIYYENYQLTPSFPTPMITKIILGYQYHNSLDLINKLKEMALDCLGYSVEVRPTRLAMIYNDIKD